MARGNLIGLGVLAGVLAAAGIGLTSFSGWLAGDWRKVSECSSTYWTCEAIVGGANEEGGGQPAAFTRLARSCREFDAWEVAVRRASFDCTMERDIVPASCKLVEATCALPDRLH